MSLSRIPTNLTTLMRGLGRAAGTRRHWSPKADGPFTCRGPARGDGLAGNDVLPPAGPTLVMIEWVRQLGGRRGTSCFPPQGGGRREERTPRSGSEVRSRATHCDEEIGQKESFLGGGVS